jgi:hypothetical protein
MEWRDHESIQITLAAGANTAVLHRREDYDLFVMMDALEALAPQHAARYLSGRLSLRGAVDQFSTRSGLTRQDLTVTFGPAKTVHPLPHDHRARGEKNQAAALASLRQDPEKALRHVQSISPEMRSDAMAAMLRAAPRHGAETAARLSQLLIQYLPGLFPRPADRIRLWPEIAKAAPRPELALRLLQKGFEDAATIQAADVEPGKPDSVLREFRDSTRAYREVGYGAGTVLGPQAEQLLAQIQDPEAALLVQIEMARGMLGLPASQDSQ